MIFEKDSKLHVYSVCQNVVNLVTVFLLSFFLFFKHGRKTCGLMKHSYESKIELITSPSIREVCQREMGALGETQREKGRGEGKREMGTDRLSERKDRKAERG